MQMDARRRWMYGERRSPVFLAGLHKFLVVAEANKEDGFMPCPCVDCRNVKEHSSSKTLQGHLIRRGFMPSYNCWTKHGERGVMMEDDEEENDDENYRMFSGLKIPSKKTQDTQDPIRKQSCSRCLLNVTPKVCTEIGSPGGALSLFFLWKSTFFVR